MSAAGRLLEAFTAYCTARGGDRRLAAFLEGFDWAMAERELAAQRLPVVERLAEVTPPARTEERTLLAALAAAAPALHWAQTYSAADFGEDFLRGYGWVELFGTRGHFDSAVMAGGFLLLGPGIHYPDHHHIAEEIYIPLTSGSHWSKDGGPFEPRMAGDLIHHPSAIRHAMKTEREPLAALYLWRGGPLAQKSVISRD